MAGRVGLGGADVVGMADDAYATAAAQAQEGLAA